ncbi:Hypothetical_protein [Hexamita inflata]|uniref:Hypothetical_protein n=1 Tax=Hexamita inflata TaxID=28002 RepID=A0ABP1GWD5_9EUKA
MNHNGIKYVLAVLAWIRFVRLRPREFLNSSGQCVNCYALKKIIQNGNAKKRTRTVCGAEVTVSAFQVIRKQTGFVYLIKPNGKQQLSVRLFQFLLFFYCLFCCFLLFQEIKELSGDEQQLQVSCIQYFTSSRRNKQIRVI